MKNIMAVFVAFALLGVASVAAATLTPEKVGWEHDGDWTYTTNLSYNGTGCSTEDWACAYYYAPYSVCDADGMYARADTPNSLYYFNAYYSISTTDWTTTVDTEGCTYIPGAWPNPGSYLCRGTEQGGYNNWDAPGANDIDPFMAFNFKYSSPGIMLRYEFEVRSCNWIE
ncbi:MAG: hypothetical protein M0R80_05530 [Proteobacteria bacterium]|jgi:hypothetical protein|nr:hypothetical protein [Pseudomonadota bacterium]